MAFKSETQKRAETLAQQAPAMLCSHRRHIVAIMQAKLRYMSSAYERLVLAWDIALFTVAFSTPERGTKLARTLIYNALCV